MQPHPPIAPPKRTGAAVAWDPAMHEVLLFGGQASDQALLDDTWAWNGSSWREIPSAGLTPSASPMISMAYDEELRAMVLVESDIHFEAPIQLWIWDGVLWRPRSVSGGPTSPVAAIGFDPPHTDDDRHRRRVFGLRVPVADLELGRRELAPARAGP